MRRRVIAGVLAVLAAPTRALAQVGSAARSIADARLGGIVGYAVVDDSGALLAGANTDIPMPPASVTKAVTTLFALERLGPDHHFVTRVMMAGARNGGVLHGDLILVGGGDPTLDTDRLGDLAAALALTGLRQVTGRYYVYDGALPYRARIAPDQPEHVGYNPAISGLLLNYNRVNFVWAAVKNGWAVEMNAEGLRFAPVVAAAAVSVAQRGAPLFIYEADTPIERWSVAASGLGQGGSRWLPLRHPAPYAAEVFATLCRAQGLELGGAAPIAAVPADAQVLVQDQSAALADILRGMLKYSTNITAEAVGLAASGAGSTEASAQMMTDWARGQFGITARFGDHSGLGPNTACTAADMARIMIAARKLPQGRALMGLMRESGISNANGREDKTSAVRVHFKSGTLNFVSGLAGYLRAPAGKILGFAIFAADNPRRSALPMEAREDPPGGAAWTRRARKMQRLLIADWAKRWL